VPHEDADSNLKMNNFAKEEEQHKNRYLSYAEQSNMKSDGNFIITNVYYTRNYYDEEIDRDESFYHLPTWKPSMRKYFQKRCLTGSNWYQYCSFSQENFKRFYKLPKVRQQIVCTMLRLRFKLYRPR
jgi:hypothetical protein